MIKNFFKDSAIYTIPTLLIYGVNFFLLPLYTKVLSPSDYGALDLLKVFESLISLTVAFEVSQGLARFFIDEKNNKKRISYASSAFWFSFFCFFCFLFLALFFSPILSRLVFGSSSFEPEFRLGSCYISINCLYLLVMNQLRFEMRSLEYAKISFISFITTAFFSVIFAYFLKWKLLGMILGLLSGSLMGLFLGLYHVKKTYYKLHFSINRLKEMLVFSAPLVPSSAFVFFNSYIDRMMINHYMTLNEVGLFGVGFRIACIVSILLVGFNRAFVPLIIKNYSDPKTPRQVECLFRYFFICSLLLFAGLSIFSFEILYFLTAPSFYSARYVVAFLVPAILLSQMYIFFPGLTIAKKTNIIMYITIICTVINIALNSIFVPNLGYIGAGIATLISQLISFVIMFKLSQKFYRIPIKWRPILSNLILTILIILIAISFDRISSTFFLFKFFMLTIFIYFLYSSALISKSEKNYIINFFRSRA